MNQETNTLKKIYTSAFIIVAALMLSACAPELGSKEWCDDLDEKPKGDWTANEANDYAQHCLFQSRDEE